MHIWDILWTCLTCVSISCPHTLVEPLLLSYDPLLPSHLNILCRQVCTGSHSCFVFMITSEYLSHVISRFHRAPPNSPDLTAFLPSSLWSLYLADNPGQLLISTFDKGIVCNTVSTIAESENLWENPMILQVSLVPKLIWWLKKQELS